MNTSLPPLPPPTKSSSTSPTPPNHRWIVMQARMQRAVFLPNRTAKLTLTTQVVRPLTRPTVYLIPMTRDATSTPIAQLIPMLRVVQVTTPIQIAQPIPMPKAAQPLTPTVPEIPMPKVVPSPPPPPSSVNPLHPTPARGLLSYLIQLTSCQYCLSLCFPLLHP